MAKALEVGDKASLSKAFTEEDVVSFASLSTDTNPIHLDHDYAAATIFKEPIVHGMLVSSLFSGLIGVVLPGKGSIYLGQNITFKAPVHLGEQVTATVEIIKIREDKPIVTLKTVCTVQDKIVIEGEAVVKIPD